MRVERREHVAGLWSRHAPVRRAAPRPTSSTAAGMEGREPGGGSEEPAEPAELLSLIIGGEEEATREESDRGDEDGLANGHAEGEESEAGMVTPATSPGTSYWNITEGLDQPFLLSPAPGPSARKPRVQRASRPGLSRIPGRDHRRYYHEYWRCEYLMDFDPRRHGMICMVCGSSLATLKLSTIKRHIRQKHPDSLLWSAADKEVIRSGWESHLSLGALQRADGSAAPETEERPDSDRRAADGSDSRPDPSEPDRPPSSEEGDAPQQQQEEEAEPRGPAGPSARTLERYLNDSLHAWFRQEFLMEYEAAAGRLLCMVCGGELPSLHLDHIKSHVLDTHPASLLYSSGQKHCILQAWAQAHDPPEPSIKPEPDTKEGGPDLSAQEAKAAPVHGDSDPDGAGPLTRDAYFIGENGGVGAAPAPRGAPPPRQPRKRRLHEGDPWRLRLDYLVAHGPRGRGAVCMVCSQLLHEVKVSCFRRHIQECHPETTGLSRQEREAMAAAWTKEASSGSPEAPDETDPDAAAEDILNMAAEMKEDASPDLRAVKEEEGVSGESAAPPRHGHYPGKDQRRNYQVRWRTEYLMDYDCRRHGLICMVCGATLATLKVSTIKRHVQQVHPRSLDYGPEDKQQALLSYNQAALHFIHSDDCGSSQDHGHTEPAAATHCGP